jgi:hypothetical protein
MHFSLAAIVAFVGAASATLTTSTQYETNCWTATTLHTTVPAAATTVTTTLPLTTTVTRSAWLIVEPSTTFAYKRDTTVIVSDVCVKYQTATAVETAYTTNPKLTATATSYAHTATTTVYFATESVGFN